MTPLPQIDHFVGRPVTSIQAEPSHGEDAWSVTFEGDVRIVSTDPLYEMPDESIVGYKLSRVDMSAQGIVLNFGTDDNPLASRMHLSTVAYGISDPNYNDGELVNPQLPQHDFNAARPADPSAERVADGPEERLATDDELRGLSEDEQAAVDAVLAEEDE